MPSLLANECDISPLATWSFHLPPFYGFRIVNNLLLLSGTSLNQKQTKKLKNEGNELIFSSSLCEEWLMQYF